MKIITQTNTINNKTQINQTNNKNQNIQTQQQETEDFQIYIASQPDPDTTIITSTQELSQKWLEDAMYKFNNNYHQYSTILTESSISSIAITDDMIDTLALNAQSNLVNINQINQIVKLFINKDTLIGKVYETIENNINTDYKLSYKDFSNNRNKNKILEKAKEIINDFNSQINIKSLIRKSIPIAYSEGNYTLYLRNKNGNYTIDTYPLGVIEISDYEVDGEPYLLCNINELTGKLRKIYTKTKKGKSLFFKDIKEEIGNNYPEEIYNAYINKEQYAKLNIKNSGVLRVNNLNRKYGLTPIFKSLKSAIMLDTFNKTDKINAKAKGKKIIFQKLRKEVLGQDGSNKALEEMAYAHDSFMAAWKNDTVVYTGAAFVEDVKYVEPKVDNVNTDTITYYKSEMMLALGISFLNQGNQTTFTLANLSVKELMRLINKISEQLEDIIEKWYKLILIENGIDITFSPKISIIDSEFMEMEIKLKLVEILYSKLNCSFETAYSIVGIDIKDELQKRKNENDEGYSEIFFPHPTSYNSNGESVDGNIDDQGGKPKGNAINKDNIDQFDNYNIEKKNNKN